MAKKVRWKFGEDTTSVRVVAVKTCFEESNSHLKLTFNIPVILKGRFDSLHPKKTWQIGRFELANLLTE